METEEFLIEIPSPPPAYGAETAQWIKDQIIKHPHLHDQKDWAVKTSCGTRRCIAGWAALVHGEVFDAEVQQSIDSGVWDYARTIVEAGDYGEVTWGEWVGAKAAYRSYEPVGRRVLELDADETQNLFYSWGDSRALMALDLIIAGKEVNEENLALLERERSGEETATR